MKTACSTFAFAPYLSAAEAIDRIARAGFDGVELSMQTPECAGWLDGNLADALARFRLIKRAARDAGVALALAHAPFSECAGADTDGKHLEAQLQKALAVCELLEISHLIVHPEKRPESLRAEAAGNARAVNLLFFERLRPYLIAYNIRACAENTAGVSVGAIADLTDALNGGETSNPRYGVCLDIGHPFPADPKGAAEDIRALGGRIAILHVRGPMPNETRDQSRAVNWRDIIDALQDIGYQGYLSVVPYDCGQALFEDSARVAADAAKRLRAMAEEE